MGTRHLRSCQIYALVATVMVNVVLGVCGVCLSIIGLKLRQSAVVQIIVLFYNGACVTMGIDTMIVLLSNWIGMSRFIKLVL